MLRLPVELLRLGRCPGCHLFTHSHSRNTAPAATTWKRLGGNLPLTRVPHSCCRDKSGQILLGENICPPEAFWARKRGSAEREREAGLESLTQPGRAGPEQPLWSPCFESGGWGGWEREASMATVGELRQFEKLRFSTHGKLRHQPCFSDSIWVALSVFAESFPSPTFRNIKTGHPGLSGRIESQPASCGARGLERDARFRLGISGHGQLQQSPRCAPGPRSALKPARCFSCLRAQHFSGGTNRKWRKNSRLTKRPHKKASGSPLETLVCPARPGLGTACYVNTAVNLDFACCVNDRSKKH